MPARASTTNTSTQLDPSDVPAVGARELAVVLNILSAGRGILALRGRLGEGDLGRVEEAFWKLSSRHRTRKAAVLLRFRSLLDACQSRHLAVLLDQAGQEALQHALRAAATMRLNTKWGFNPHKLARAVREALAAGEGAVLAAA